MGIKKPIKYEGITYTSEVELCKAYEADYNLYQTRKRRGLPTNECLQKGRITLRGKSITYKGHHYKNMVELCNKNNKNYNTFLRERNEGLSVEESINSRPKREIVYNEVTYPSERKMCKALGVVYHDYQNRKQRGLPLPERLVNKVCKVKESNICIFSGYNQKGMRIEVYYDEEETLGEEEIKSIRNECNNILDSH